MQRVYNLKREDGQIAERVVFVEDYDIDVARHLVSGCDVWVNLPRKPMEASGTSGMKAAFNGVLQLSVLDGWWAEGFDGTNGWGIPGDEDPDPAVADLRDATTFYDLLEHEVVPLFYERDAAACRCAGASGSRRRSRRAGRCSARRGWSTTTPRGCMYFVRDRLKSVPHTVARASQREVVLPAPPVS